jgi:hypothetical protein
MKNINKMAQWNEENIGWLSMAKMANQRGVMSKKYGQLGISGSQLGVWPVMASAERRRNVAKAYLYQY